MLIQNVNAARAWFKAGGPGRGLPLNLAVRHDFQLLERTAQPTLPGPLAEDFDTWDARPRVAEAAAVPIKTPDREGSGKGLGPHRKLRVVD